MKKIKKLSGQKLKNCPDNFSYILKGAIVLKDARIEIRISNNLKENFQNYAKKHNTKISDILREYILFLLKEDDKNAK